VVPLAVLFVSVVLLRPTGGLQRAFDRAPAVRAGLVAVMVMGIVGFLVNDSGVAVPALALTVAVPIALAASLSAGVSPDR
jgi:diacylglycerol kinase